jgi:hypothetical protein
MRSTRYPRTRPEDFRLNSDCQLAQGLVFLGAGRFPESKYFHDSSLYGNHGTLTNMAVPATATSGWAWDSFLGRWRLNCDGTNDHVLVGNPVTTQVNNFSLCGWINPRTLPQTTSFLIYNGTDACGYGMGICAVDQGSATNVGGLFGSIAWLTTTTPMSGVELWDHIALVYGQSTGKFYFNGRVLAETVTATPKTPVTRCTVGNQDARCYVVGSLADPMVYNRALSVSEIAALANPSNVMLSGLLLPPRRRSFAAAAATGNRRRRVLCSGA